MVDFMIFAVNLLLVGLRLGDGSWNGWSWGNLAVTIVFGVVLLRRLAVKASPDSKGEM